jgi:hypothetical protein
MSKARIHKSFSVMPNVTRSVNADLLNRTSAIVCYGTLAWFHDRPYGVAGYTLLLVYTSNMTSDTRAHHKMQNITTWFCHLCTLRHSEEWNCNYGHCSRTRWNVMTNSSTTAKWIPLQETRALHGFRTTVCRDTISAYARKPSDTLADC